MKIYLFDIIAAIVMLIALIVLIFNHQWWALGLIVLAAILMKKER